MLGKNLFAPAPQEFRAVFSDAGGINPGAKVLMAGVRIGQVSEVELGANRKAGLTLAIDPDVRIPKGSYAVLPTSLIGIGDNPISIVPPRGDVSEFLVAGNTIEGRRLGPLDGIAPDLLPNLNVTLSELNKTLVATRSLMGDEGLKSELTQLLAQTKTTLQQFGSLASGANSALAENRGALKDSMSTFALAMKDVQKASSMAAKLLADPKYKDQAGQILANLNETSKKAASLMTEVEAMVTDPKLRESIDATVANMNSIMNTGTKIASNTETMTANGITASENVVEITKKVSQLADDAREVLEKIQRFFEKPTGVGALDKAKTQAEVVRDLEDGRFRVDFNLKYPITDGSLHVGLYDAFESNKLNFQIGRPINKSSEYRYGMYAGKPGLGVDYSLTSKVRLRGDAYGLNDSHLDVRAEFALRNDLLGIIGIYRLGERNQLTVGVGIKK
jgi:phospholipid/cholesterol/gamma-HCH transport system substrate-binding protein